MQQQNQSQIHLILPSNADQKYHFCLKTPDDLNNAAQALLERKSFLNTPPFTMVNDAIQYLLKNYREHYAPSDALDFGSPSVWEGGQQKYNGQTLLDYIKSEGLLEQWDLNLSEA
jgi:hypothetical protein